MKNNKFRAVVRQLVGAVTLTFIATLILVPGAWAARNQTLYAFTGGNDGGSPVAAVTFDAAGNLYGTAFNGGANGNGTVFKLTRNSDGSWTESVLHTFCSFTSCGDGAQPGSTLIFDAAGNLYGT